MEVECNENQSEIDLRKMEWEFGLEDDRVVADALRVQKEVVIEMADTRTL